MAILNSSEGNYTVSVHCSNCGYQGSISLPKGTPINNPLGHQTECPHCGCHTLNKSAHLPKWRDTDYLMKGGNSDQIS